MKLTFDDLQGWEFDVDEVSAGVYRVRGRDRLGHCVVVTGENPEPLLDECKAVARKAGGCGDDHSSSMHSI